MTLQEWQQYSTERVSQMILNRARRACKDAGLDPTLLGIHPHNAMVSFEQGKPWKGINYSLVRRCLWLQRKSWVPSEIASKISDRAWKRVD